VGVLKEHYMALKDSERILLADIDQKATIHSADIPAFMKILNILKDVDSETMCVNSIRGVTDTVKLDLSLSEQAKIFYGLIPNNSLKDCSLMSLVLTGIGAPTVLAIVKMLENDVPTLEVIGFAAANIMPATMIGYWLGCLPSIYFFRYQDHLKTNILPNQLSLTDYLKKTGS